MIEIRLLGHQSVKAADGNEVLSVSAQPKRLALLVYLTLSSADADGFVSRDQVLGFFWPESDQGHSRNTLNQHIFGLRGSLGSEVILSHGVNRLGINHEQVWCDAVEFQRAIKAKEWERALNLYDGDFLAGFFVSGVPELEKWLDNQRLACERQALEAGLALAREEESSANWAEAVKWYRRATEIAPESEPAMRGLSLAIANAEKMDDRQAEAAEPVTPAAIRHVVTANIASAQPQVSGGMSTILLMIAALGVVGVIAGSWIGLDPTGEGGATIHAPKTLAVLPFANVNGDDENRLIAVGIHDDLVTKLSHVSALRVTSRTSVREYANTAKSLRDIAGELGVEYILEASVRSAGGQVRVNINLVAAATDEQLWSEQYDRDVTTDNLFEIQSDITRRVVTALEAQLTPQEVETLDAMEPAADLAAQSWYYRGVEAYESAVDDDGEARDHLVRALEIDPEFVAAWSYLARVESRRLFVGDDEEEGARVAMERTVELAPGSIEAHLARGYFEYYALRDFDEALIAFRAAERLSPSDAEVLWAISLILRRQGKWEASTEMMKRVVQLEPRVPSRLEGLYESLRFLGAHREADAVTGRALSIAPGNPRARTQKVYSVVHLDGATDRAWRLAGDLSLRPHQGNEGPALALLAILDRNYTRALEILEQVIWPDSPLEQMERLFRKSTVLSWLGDPSTVSVADSLLAIVPPKSMSALRVAGYHSRAHVVAGHREQALQELETAERLVRQWEDAFNDMRWATSLVVDYGQLGELDAGLALLTDIIDRPARYSVTSLKLYPGYDPYRADPRFDDLVRRREAFEAEGARKAQAGGAWLP